MYVILVFHLQPTKYIYNTRLQFNGCWVRTVCQVTILNHYSKCPPTQSVHALSRLSRQCHTPSKVPRRLRMVWQASKCVAEVSLHFQVQLQTFYFFSIPKDKNLKDWVPHSVGLNLDNFLKHTLIRKFFLLFAWGIHFRNMSNLFRYTL